MPTSAGITVSQIEYLLECVTRATKSEKQAAFARLGLKVLRGTHTRMARSLIKRAATQGAAVAAAMEVWWEYANDKARDALRSASLDGKGPPRARRPPSTNAFFKANGEVTPVGEFAFEWVRANGARGQRGPAVPTAPASENVQGGPEHQALQRALCQVGRRRGFHVETNHDVESDFRPDVLWFRLNPRKHHRASPLAVFEIEFGVSAPLAKSLSSLAHCHEQWPGTKLFLLVPRHREQSARDRLGTSHRGIKDATKVMVVEDCAPGLAEFEAQLGLVPPAEEPRCRTPVGREDDCRPGSPIVGRARSRSRFGVLARLSTCADGAFPGWNVAAVELAVSCKGRRTPRTYARALTVQLRF